MCLLCYHFKSAATKRKKSAAAPVSRAKKPKVDRRLDENSAGGSIFGLM